MKKVQEQQKVKVPPSAVASSEEKKATESNPEHDYYKVCEFYLHEFDVGP